MTKKEVNEAILELLGWTKRPIKWWERFIYVDRDDDYLYTNSKGVIYSNSINYVSNDYFVRLLVENIPEEFHHEYTNALSETLRFKLKRGVTYMDMVNAHPEEKAIAFLKILNKWTNDN